MKNVVIEPEEFDELMSSIDFDHQPSDPDSQDDLEEVIVSAV